jgi:hypothetical protein
MVICGIEQAFVKVTVDLAAKALPARAIIGDIASPSTVRAGLTLNVCTLAVVVATLFQHPPEALKYPGPPPKSVTNILLPELIAAFGNVPSVYVPR